jgi:hypothetical protein
VIAGISRHNDPLEIAAIFLAQCIPQQPRVIRQCHPFAIKGDVMYDLGNTIMILMIVVEAQLVVDPQSIEQDQPDAHGQAYNVNKGISFVFKQVAAGNPEVCNKHRIGLSTLLSPTERVPISLSVGIQFLVLDRWLGMYHF